MCTQKMTLTVKRKIGNNNSLNLEEEKMNILLHADDESLTMQPTVIIKNSNENDYNSNGFINQGINNFD